MKLNVEKYYPKEAFERNNVEIYLCVTRKKLIKKTPEETIRQAFIYFLFNKRKESTC